MNSDANNINFEPEVKAPWIKNLGGVPSHLEYFQGSMYEKVAEIAAHYPNYIAYDFMGSRVKYKDFIQSVDQCARALAAIGVKEGESVTICMPNCPQAVPCFMQSIKLGPFPTWFTLCLPKRKLNSA